jgi:hypothetical protein
MTTLSLALPAYEAAINELHDEVQFTLHMQDELLRLFPPVYVVHTGTTRLVSSPNILDKPITPQKTKFSMRPVMFLETDAAKMKEVMYGMTQSLLDQLKQQTADVMVETGEAVGHSIDGKGRNYWDTYIEMLEKAPYSKYGFTVFMNEETEKKIKEAPPTAEQKQKTTDVIKAKREEFYAKKHSRRLS